MKRVCMLPGKKKEKKGLYLYIRSMGLIFTQIQVIGKTVAGRNFLPLCLGLSPAGAL